MTRLTVPVTLSPQIAARMEFIRRHVTDNPHLADRVTALLADCAGEQDLTAAITTLHRLQRCYLAATVGLLGHPAIIEAIDHADFPLWDRYTILSATEAQKDQLARLMYEGDIQRRAPVFLSFGDYSRDIAERILQRCVAAGDETDIAISDPLFQRRLLTHCDADKAGMLGRIMTQPYDYYGRMISLRIEQTEQTFPDGPVPPAIQKAYNEPLKIVAEVSRKKFYTVSVLPTPKDAALDHIPYDDYVDLYFRMVSVDWDRVDQAHRVLIAQLDAAKILRFTNSDGTDLTLSVDGFTFCNSLVAKNVPGSEVFSAPHRDSATGIVVGQGRYLFNGRLMENITLHFDRGRVVEYSAETGLDVLAKMIETDEGSHYMGEIALGTNPVLRTHLVNGLLVEKIGGSFHFALGTCYKFTDYNGVPVRVDNGNISAIHEDITVMLYGKNGRIHVDGQCIMEEGRFLDPRLAALNGMH